VIKEGVVERLNNEVAGVECIDKAVVVVNDIGVGAVVLDGESA